MKQLVIAVLVVAVLSLGYRLAGTFRADADTGAAPPPPKQVAPSEPKPKETIEPAAVRVDRPSAERKVARDEMTGPNRTRRGDAASQRSTAVPRSAAKPLAGAAAADLATARTPPPEPPRPLMFGPDGAGFQKLGAAHVSGLRLTPPPTEEPLVQGPSTAAPEPESVPEVVRADKPLPSAPLPSPPALTVTPGKMVGPDGIEFHAVRRAH